MHLKQATLYIDPRCKHQPMQLEDHGPGDGSAPDVHAPRFVFGSGLNKISKHHHQQLRETPSSTEREDSSSASEQTATKARYTEKCKESREHW